jgi:hypothetical protein
MKNNKIFFNYSPKLIFFFLCILSVLSVPEDVLSWRGKTHTKMTEDAIKLVPKMPNDIFEIYASELKSGVLEPDKNRVIDHTDVAACAMMIDRLAKKCERMIKNNEDWAKIMFTLGQATHYVQDLNTPVHCIKVQKNMHEDFEKIAVEGNWREDKYKGFYYIKDYKILAGNICNFSARYISFVNKLYFKNDPELLKKIMEPLWSHTVQDVVDFWFTIFKNGFGEVKYKELGLPEPLGIRDGKDVKYEKIKNL